MRGAGRPHKSPLGKLLAHALERRKQRPIKEGTLRIDGKATALERSIARSLIRNRRNERLVRLGNILLADIHPLRAPWGKALARTRKLRPIGADKNKRLVRQERICRSIPASALQIVWDLLVSVLRTLVQVPEHHARRARPGGVRDMGKRRVRSEALGPAGAEAADGAAKAPVCDQLIEEGDAGGRRVLQAHNARSEGNQVCNRRRGVGGIDSGSARPHDAFEPVDFLQAQRAPRNRYCKVERRATRLRYARLGLGSRSGKHAHGDAARSGSVKPARAYALGEHQAIGTLYLEEAGQRGSIEGAGLVEKLGPHFRREEKHRVPLPLERPLRTGSRSRDARPHASDENDFTVRFFHIRSTFLRERRRTMRHLPCVITISKQRPAETCASSTARPAETKDNRARSSSSA
ncbi:hypothetical protein ACTNEU_06955 [Ellagibacter isourolithinifaciens]|uniref:hypothetical protein n=1 Tax=Ellagibacter isourolithinifaciens TaxID=2137581 RepID=UPI003F8C4F88